MSGRFEDGAQFNLHVRVIFIGRNEISLSSSRATMMAVAAARQFFRGAGVIAAVARDKHLWKHSISFAWLGFVKDKLGHVGVKRCIKVTQIFLFIALIRSFLRMNRGKCSLDYWWRFLVACPRGATADVLLSSSYGTSDITEWYSEIPRCLGKLFVMTQMRKSKLAGRRSNKRNKTEEAKTKGEALNAGKRTKNVELQFCFDSIRWHISFWNWTSEWRGVV